MGTNWKRGVTRLYFLLWVLWFAYMAISLLSLPPILWQVNYMRVVVWGLVAPGLLFLGVRWVANGFLPNGKRSGEQT